MKKTFYSEIAYFFGLYMLALGTAFMERADFGVSMIVAPAYILHLKISQYFSFFSFGMAEYCLQFVILILMTIIFRKFKKAYIFSFVTAFLYGMILDLNMYLIGMIPTDLFAIRCVLFAVGQVLCSVGVGFLFRTYIPPEAYEYIVKEISEKFSWNIAKVKTCYDFISLTIAVVLSFCFFGWFHFEGVRWGTLLAALVNGWMIGQIIRLQDKYLDFKDALKLRSFFT